MRVYGVGPIPCEWMVVGEGPGQDEDRRGEPFVGKTGKEMRRFFDGISLPDFEEEVFRTNVYRQYGGKDYEWTDEDFATDEPELLDELRRVQPKVIVAVGRYATRYFLGDVTMDEVHGLPWLLSDERLLHIFGERSEDRESAPSPRRVRQTRSGKRGSNSRRVVVFPTYHPAAGFRNPEASALVAYDFAQLVAFAEGSLTPRKLYDDAYPNPQYFHVTSLEVIKTHATLPAVKLAFDSEGIPRAPWSIQWSRLPGTGYLARLEDTDVVRAFLDWITKDRVRLVYHSALHDRAVIREFAKRLGWDERRIIFDLDTLKFDDTMVRAYLLQMEPQGLKDLCTRHANMRMQSFDEITEKPHNKAVMKHLVRMWDLLNADYEIEQQEAFEEINRTPLRDKQGRKKRNKDGSVRTRRTTKLPTPPKSDLFKAVERCMRSKTPYKLYEDQREDIKVAGYTLAGEMPERTLSLVEFPTALHYGCRDADGTIRVEPELESRIKALDLEHVYNLELATYPLIDRMARVGVKPDLKVFGALSKKLGMEIAKLQVKIETTVGVEGFNPNSGDQVAEYLFHTIGLEPIKMTNSGSRESTNDKILEALEKEHGHEHPVISDMRAYRETYKLKHTFVDRIPDFVHRYPNDGRVHSTFRTTRVPSGRLAASDPNLLAQPEHGQFAKDFKAGWVAEDGHVICNWDESQIELRVLADLSEDPVLCSAYAFRCRHERDWQGGKTICRRDECVLVGDLHAKLAYQVFGVKPSGQDDSKHRLPAKACNFGLAMGMTCHGLMIELRKNGVEVDEDGAQEWIDAADRTYKRVPKYKANKIAEARRNGFVRCLSGRIRYIGGIRSTDERVRAEAERFAFSTPIQEGAQRTMKEAEIYIWEEILMKKYYRDGWHIGGSRGRYVEPLLQVHDALKFEVAIGLEQTLHKEISYAMTKVPTQLRIPLGVEGKFGPNFKDMKKFV